MSQLHGCGRKRVLPAYVVCSGRLGNSTEIIHLELVILPITRRRSLIRCLTKLSIYVEHLQFPPKCKKLSRKSKELIILDNCLILFFFISISFHCNIIKNVKFGLFSLSFCLFLLTS